MIKYDKSTQNMCITFVNNSVITGKLQRKLTLYEINVPLQQLKYLLYTGLNSEKLV